MMRGVGAALRTILVPALTHFGRGCVSGVQLLLRMTQRLASATPLLASTLCYVASPAGAARAQTSSAADVETLLAGVAQIPRVGTPGGLIAYGEQAFPVLAIAACAQSLHPAGSRRRGDADP